MGNQNRKLPSSFRDPSGFIFEQDGVLYRQINKAYKTNYDYFMESGLCKKLIDDGFLIFHQETSEIEPVTDECYKIIKPDEIGFISYSYEWCFSELKDAALLTLEIQKIALEHGMSLKDASAYNIQFHKGKPIFIDTLSFEKYKEGEPWVAYHQFCQHFLAPLSLMKYKDIRLNKLLRIFLDGIPLDLASKLLPKRTYSKFSLLTHIHLHAKSQNHYADKTVNLNKRKISKFQLFALVDSLESFIKNLNLPKIKTEWSDYVNNTNYTDEAHENKKEIIEKFISGIKPKSAWDLGANTGIFSNIVAKQGIPTVSFDIDPLAIEKNYLECKKNGEQNILPLILDLTNPSPSIGWNNNERLSLAERGPVDLLMALALIHHLAISNNTPFEKIAEFFSKLGQHLIIEFVPKDDSQVQRLLRTREDVFGNYNETKFEKEFGKYFQIKQKIKINGTERSLYLMEKKD